jgi:hypothetical protein
MFFISIYILFIRMREKVGVKVVKALKRKDHGVTHAAINHCL